MPARDQGRRRGLRVRPDQLPRLHRPRDRAVPEEQVPGHARGEAAALAGPAQRGHRRSPDPDPQGQLLMSAVERLEALLNAALEEAREEARREEREACAKYLEYCG